MSAPDVDPPPGAARKDDLPFLDHLRGMILGNVPGGGATLPDVVARDAGREGVPAAGNTIGRYLLLEPLGAGAQSTVWRALHLGLLKPVALKVLRAAAAADSRARERFDREARIASRLTHPNIVAVRDVGEEAGVPFLAMDLVEGPTLREWALALRPDAAASAQIAAKVAQALDHAHRQGVVHRDLKPENILVDPAGEPVIVDLGLARAAEDVRATQDGARLGTPAFMAPEQVRGGSAEADARADIYALGAILYELITGSVPFEGRTVDEVYAAILTDRPVPPSARNPAVGRDGDAVCLRCLEKVPGNRYATAADLAADLVRLSRGEAPLAARLSLPRRFWRRAVRNRLLSSVAVLAAAAAIAGGFGASEWREARALRDRALAVSEAQRRAAGRIQDLLNEALEAREHGKGAAVRVLAEAGRLLAPGDDPTGTAAGHLAWLRFVSGADPGRRALRDAVAAAPDNPVLHILLARSWLLEYAEDASWPELIVAFGRRDRAVEATGPAETDRLRACREEASRAVAAARASALWPHVALDAVAGFVAAVEAYARGRWRECVLALAEPGAVTELFVESHLLLTLANQRTLDHEAAASAARRLAERRPGLGFAKVNLAMALRGRAAALAASGGDPRPVLAEAQRALDGTDQSPRVEMLRAALDLIEAECAAASGGFWREAQERAVGRYDAILDADPANVEARINRASALVPLAFGSPELTGYHDRALEDLRVAEAARPADPLVLRNRILVEADRLKRIQRFDGHDPGPWQELRADTERLAQLGAEPVLVAYSRGSISFNEGDVLRTRKLTSLPVLREAEAEFEALVAEAPEWGEVRQYLCLTRFVIGWDDPRPGVEALLANASDAERLAVADPRYAFLRERALSWLDHILIRAGTALETEEPILDVQDLLRVAEAAAMRSEGTSGSDLRRLRARADIAWAAGARGEDPPADVLREGLAIPASGDEALIYRAELLYLSGDPAAARSAAPASGPETPRLKRRLQRLLIRCQVRN